jgi:hypothetical protein
MPADSTPRTWRRCPTTAPHEPNGHPERFRQLWPHKLANCLKHHFEAGVTFPFELLELTGQLFVRRKNRSYPNESPHHLNTSLNRHRAVYNACQHHSAVLREGVGSCRMTPLRRRSLHSNGSAAHGSGHGKNYAWCVAIAGTGILGILFPANSRANAVITSPPYRCCEWSWSRSA